jgi:hypothetical protein
MRARYLVAIGLLLAVPCGARIITVDDDGPADFNNIQAAINAGANGDTIIVKPGTYTENIAFHGRNVVLTGQDIDSQQVVASTVIDGAWQGSTVTFAGTETTSCALRGLTITKGRAQNGGGICGNGTRASVENNFIVDNMAVHHQGEHGWGAGLYDCDGLVKSNLIRANRGLQGGGLHSCDGLITGNLLVANSSGLFNCNGTIANCAVVGSLRSGLEQCNGTITGCIIWHNNGLHWIYAAQVKDCSVPSYCCIQDWENGGTGNISADPAFARPGQWMMGSCVGRGGPYYQWPNTDYRLKSQAGRWDPKTQTWVQDDVTSPCIDAGDPMSPIGSESFPNGGVINMGAYGGTGQASKSYFGQPVCETTIAGDINGDCRVDFVDFMLMALHWLQQGR